MKFENGFYTALGTPIDENGDLVEASLRKHVNQQIEAGASGLLLMEAWEMSPISRILHMRR